MKKRHDIECYYSIRAIVNNEYVQLNMSEWRDRTPEGLAEFMKKNAPNWQRIILAKYTQTIDLKKKKGMQIVNHKLSYLKISRQNSREVQGVKVDGNMTKNGKIPQNIYTFFGKNER